MNNSQDRFWEVHYGTNFALMGEMTEKMLRSSADGVFCYEHCGNDHRTWKTIAAAKRATMSVR